MSGDMIADNIKIVHQCRTHASTMAVKGKRMYVSLRSSASTLHQENLSNMPSHAGRMG